jgi:uncharacterized protein YdaU (DUF1376 family)
MHYYKRNIGDYHKKAGRLTMLQHGAYALLLDSCYDRERFPTLEEAKDWLWASTPEEEAAVEFVLKKFFDLDGDVYIQNRIQCDLDQYHKNSATNKRIAIEREAKRKDKSTKREQTVDEAPPNHKPITNNQEPIEKNTSTKADPIPYLKIKSIWNECATTLSRCDSLSDKRKKAIKKLWNTKNDEGELIYQNADFYVNWFTYCNEDSWYNGTDNNSTNWKANIDFCLKVDNIIKKREELA